MPRQYKRKIGCRKYRDFTDEQLQKAIARVRRGQSIRKVAEEYNIPKSTLSRHLRGKQTSKYGRPCVFTSEHESAIVDCIVLCGEWGFPLGSYDIRLIVKSFLDRRGMTERRFKNNLPGPDWFRSFFSRHSKRLTQRLSQNIKRARAGVDRDIINNYFEELATTIEGIDPALIINYDETNMTDDPKRTNVIVRRGCRHPHKIVDSTKSSTSVMFATTASGHLLPPYIVYRSEHLYTTWTEGGPKGTAYNRSKNGWFNMELFEDWFKVIVLPYFRQFDNDQPKVMIGDNLASHVSPTVIEKCQEYNIRFVLLPSNSTGICQPLDVAYFKPLKSKWSKVLADWKTKNRGTLPKDVFPRLLNKCLTEMGDDNTKKNVLAGFRASGIYPLDKDEVLKRLPNSLNNIEQNRTEETTELVESFQLFLERTRTAETAPLKKRKKKVDLPPGKSVVEGMLKPEEEPGPSKQIKRKKKEQGLSELNKEKKKKRRKTTIVISDEETNSENYSIRDSGESDLSFSDFEREFDQFEYHNEPEPIYEVTIGEHTNNDIEPANNETDIEPKNNETDEEPTNNETDNIEPCDNETEKEPKNNAIDNIEPCNNEIDISVESNSSMNAVRLENLEVDQFALVEYIYNQNTKKESRKKFIGKIISITPPDRVTLRFLRESTSFPNIFTFPPVNDEDEVELCRIMKMLQPKSIVRGRHIFI